MILHWVAPVSWGRRGLPMQFRPVPRPPGSGRPMAARVQTPTDQRIWSGPRDSSGSTNGSFPVPLAPKRPDRSRPISAGWAAAAAKDCVRSQPAAGCVTGAARWPGARPCNRSRPTCRGTGVVTLTEPGCHCVLPTDGTANGAGGTCLPPARSRLGDKSETEWTDGTALTRRPANPVRKRVLPVTQR